MSRNNLWRSVFVVLVVVWALFEIFPYKNRDLIQVFRATAVRQDATFSNIVVQAQALQQERPDRAYGNLLQAVGTNAIAGYFPMYNATNEPNAVQFILNQIQRKAAGRIKLGLDLQGGTSFVLEMDTNRLMEASSDTNAGPQATMDLTGAIEQAVEVVRRRVDRLGVAEPIILPEGGNRLRVQLPGLSEDETERAKKQISRAAFLEFRMVHPKSDELLRSGETAPGYERLSRKNRKADGSERMEVALVSKRAVRGFTGAYVRSAFVARGNLGEPQIDFTLTSEGAGLFAEITRENIGQRMAIILDGELQSAPVIRSEIPNGRGVIEGNYDAREAFELANVLQNPLKAPLRTIEERKVDPSLGKDSIQSGIRAALYGVIAVIAFMLVYYLMAGAVSIVALLLNIIVLLGVMCSVGTTLTLPGIAGIVLTIGMAVDANVLIFERIREELAAKKSLRGALNAGYDKAFGTILDSNLTTLISSVILIFMGTGPVKGFGVALTIGITVSMFTALIVTRIIFDFLLERQLLKSLPMLHLVRGARIDFMKFAMPAFAVSWALILIGNGYGIFFRGKDVLGVEFVGGYSITLGFDTAARPGLEVDKIRATVDDLKKGASQVSFQREITGTTETLLVNLRSVGEEKAGEDAGAQVLTTLNQTFPTAKFKQLSVDKIGPTVGKEITKTAIIAAMLALFGILVYVAFRYEFAFAVGAVIAIIHDILMTLGWYFLAGRELNGTMVAALLTIIGFSINDTIVIFDRVREDLKLGVRGTFREVMNAALNQTLSRTIITSGTVFLATLSLYLFGGGVINDFAFAFLVGILTGTYSSIYIASAIVLWWYKGQRPSLGAAEATVENPMTAAKA